MSGDTWHWRCQTRRLRDCAEAWPDADTGAYDPHCCRWPKSCSATIYDHETTDPADLEPCTVHGDGPCAPVSATQSAESATVVSDLDTLDGWLRATEAEQFAHLFGRDIRTGRRIDGWQPPVIEALTTTKDGS